jgi:hypothetical protein
MPHYIVEENLRCFKCGSTNVGPLFIAAGDPELVHNTATGKDELRDDENYIIHHDCLACYTCKAWDFPEPEQWTHPVVTGGFTCDACGGSRLTVTENDSLADTFEVKCQKCGKEHTLEKEQPQED